MQLTLLNIEATIESVTYKGIYDIRKTMYKGIVLLENEKESIPVRVIETSDINGDFFPDTYDRISSFKNIR